MAYQFTDADRNLLKQAQANKSSLDQRQQRQLEALQKIDLIQQANRQTKAPYAQPNRQEQAAARQELGRQMKTATETMEKRKPPTTTCTTRGTLRTGQKSRHPPRRAWQEAMSA